MRTYLTEKEKNVFSKFYNENCKRLTDVAQMISQAVFDVKPTLFVQNRTTYLIY